MSLSANQLEASVAAAPVSGRATDPRVKFLLRKFGIATKNIMVVFGCMSIK
jgi:uncharacterized protein YggU (UPF0235/DUF167 family)